MVFVVGGLGFEFCVFVAGWRHALRSGSGRARRACPETPDTWPTPLNYPDIYYMNSRFPFLLAFDVGGLGFEFCVFVASWRHALRNEWPIIIITTMVPVYRMVLRYYWPGVVLG